MNYKILETHQVYNNDKLTLVAVLWQSNAAAGWVRASYFTTEPAYGYGGFLHPNAEVNNDLIQRIAAQGMNLPDALKKKYFPGKRKWER